MINMRGSAAEYELEKLVSPDEEKMQTLLAAVNAKGLLGQIGG